MGDRLATTDVPKIGGGAPLSRVNWVPILHNVARAEAYLHAKLSFIFHPSVWPQYTNVTDRTGQDNGLIAYGEALYKWSPRKLPSIKVGSTTDR